MFHKRIYLDTAAGLSGNPSSPHAEGRRSREQLEGARKAIARLVGAQSDDVIFTSGATESNALAILGFVRACVSRASHPTPLHVLYLPTAHASVVENVKLLVEEGIEAEPLPVWGARVDTDALAGMLRPETALVTMDAVCGETGVVWNTREVAEVLKNKVRPCNKVEPCFLRPVLHVDASQAPLTEKIERAHFGADLLTFDAAKVVRPPAGGRGIGALIAHRTIPLVPFYRGGGQERGLRSGTEAPELAEKFAAALRAAAQGRESFRVSAVRERERLIRAITERIPNVLINESRDASTQAPHILNLSLPAGRQGSPGRDTDYLVALLDEVGFAVSTRSACETDSEEGSRAVFALTGDRERAHSTLRVSWSPVTRPRDLARFARALSRAVAFLDANK